MRRLLTIALIFSGLSCIAQTTNQRPVPKTMFQTSSPWKPVTDIRSDITLVYGTNNRRKVTFEERVQSWREKGYITHFMTGIAWGDYDDYFNGKWDGKTHWEDGQLRLLKTDIKTGKESYDTVWHHKGVPYIIPSESFIEYMKERHVKRAIDAGIDAIYLEEPEFWAKSGYSQSFRNEWKKYYGSDWRPQHDSPENTYLSNKLKYQLYYNALKEVFSFAKSYGREKGLDVKCYVPTHSLLNYSTWEIVSPEASLASLDCVDGYIGQVWTGTARTANYYNGIRKERTFETAWLEYNCLESMVKPTGRKIIFLTDPIEDNAKDWRDYKANYQATFAAQLLFPEVNNYETMPWPDRIYEGLYTNPATGAKEKIPREYATQVQVMINALNDMPADNGQLSGSRGIGIFMENSLMFQRYPRHSNYEDKDFSAFFGQALPLVKRGIPISIIHLENSYHEATWEGLKVAVLSYSNMKPMSESYHKHIAGWVGSGGVLIYCGTDTDPFQDVPEWWNTGKGKYNTPSEHLFSMMGLPRDAKQGEYRYGKGKVIVMRTDPGEFVLKKDGDLAYFEAVKKAYESGKPGLKLETRNNFYLERGPYIIAAVLDETGSNGPLNLMGSFIDLFDPSLPVIKEKIIKPGEQAFLYDLSKVDTKKIPYVLCGASRIYNEKSGNGIFSFIAKSPDKTFNTSRVRLASKPQSVTFEYVAGKYPGDSSWLWDDASKTCLLKFPNSPEGVRVVIESGN